MRALFGLCRRSGLSVLAYHRVVMERDAMRPGEPTVEEFEARMRWVAANFDVILLWEAARPYFYLRTTEDGRLIMGGLDEPFRNPDLRGLR